LLANNGKPRPNDYSCGLRKSPLTHQSQIVDCNAALPGVDPVPMGIRHLYISPAHNYFGHYGQEPGATPTVEVEEIYCVAGRGIQGDRFLDFKPDYKGQITFFAYETFQLLRARYPGVVEPPSVLRRNVITEDLDLLGLIGQEFEIQGVRFSGTGECAPCEWMNHAFTGGAEAFLKGRGGLRARILSDGILRRNVL
jgi:MOSC domain-containing protein YiiM